MINHYIYETPIGKLYIEVQDDYLTSLSLYNGQEVQGEYLKTSLIQTIIDELDAYFKGTLKMFTIKVKPQGTDFQKKVWNALLEIPYGQSVSYMDIAKRIDNPKGCRAVGLANGKNPIIIIIPCHRVIGKSGKLVGYTGGLNIKEYLLDLENISYIRG